jgi:hypothetical protein
MGAALGPWGAAAGGVAGGIYGGFFGGSGGPAGDRSATAEQRYGGVNQNNFNVPGYQGMFNNYDRMGQTMGNGSSSFRGDQLGLGRTLQQESQGNGVGQQLVRQQARDMADRASAQQFAAVGGARPGMQAMAARNAMLGTAMAQSEVGNQSAQASGQVTLGAQQQYGGFLQGARGQDIQQQQTNNQGQLQAAMQQQELARAQQQGGMQYEQNRTSRYGALLGQNAPTTQEQYLGLMQGGLSAYAATRGSQQGGQAQQGGYAPTPPGGFMPGTQLPMGQGPTGTYPR